MNTCILFDLFQMDIVFCIIINNYSLKYFRSASSGSTSNRAIPASLQCILAPPTTHRYSYSRCLLDQWSLTSLTAMRLLKFPTAQTATTLSCRWPSSPPSQSHQSFASATSTNDVPDSSSAASTKRQKNGHDSGKLQEMNRLPDAFRPWVARGI